MQKSKPKYACLPSKIVEVWIERFCVRYDWWRRLQPTSSVSPVCSRQWIAVGRPLLSGKWIILFDEETGMWAVQWMDIWYLYNFNLSRLLFYSRLSKHFSVSVSHSMGWFQGNLWLELFFYCEKKWNDPLVFGNIYICVIICPLWTFHFNPVSLWLLFKGYGTIMRRYHIACVIVRWESETLWGICVAWYLSSSCSQNEIVKIVLRVKKYMFVYLFQHYDIWFF